MTAFVWLLLTCWLPGAVALRWPWAGRDRRAALPAEERAFWSVVLSVVWSVIVVLVLASVGKYQFERLLIVNGIVSAVPALIWRGRLRYGNARPTGWAVLVPAAIVAFSTWSFLPPSEYVIGGKDPGVYMSEGIQIAQRGGLVIADPVVASVPPGLRDLFMPVHRSNTYYSLRFMGFFVQDPARGTVIGQFPHFFPASIAIGYGINGLSGARQTVVFWAVLGVAALYFAGAQVVGRTAAAAAAGLLSVHVIQVWFARYPNSEVVMQALLLAAALAFARTLDGQRNFFGPVAAVLVALQLFLRYDAVLAIGAFAAAATLALFDRRYVGWSFVAALVLTSLTGLVYLQGPMRAYSEGPLGITRDNGVVLLLVLGIAVALACGVLAQSERWRTCVRRTLSTAMPLTLVGLAVYAYFFRTSTGRLAAYDADALRTYAWYLTPFGLLAAVVGMALMVWRHFWKNPALFLTMMTYTVFFFYKTRIVPEHFWMTRRFLAAALPATMLALATLPASLIAATSSWTPDRRARSWAVIGLQVGAWALVAVLGVTFVRASEPIRRHVEYAGLIPKLEALAHTFGDRDLVVVESRNASDVHALALPLAYIYARNVLVLDTPRPPKPAFEAFVAWAMTKYADIYFLGGGGTDILTSSITAEPVASDRFQIPEYETTKDGYPQGVRRKEFDYGLYKLRYAMSASRPPQTIQIGRLDDLNVVRFHAKEQNDAGRVFRWSRDVSYVLLQSASAGVHQVTVWMGSGGRPPDAAVPTVEIALDDHVLGSATVVDEVKPYTFPVTRALVESLAKRGEPARLRLRVPTWNPHQTLGVGDTRDLGVLVTQVDVQ